MRQLVRASAPTSKEIFGANWLYRFVRRWSLSWRKATKQKQQVVEFRLPRIQRFHQGLRKLLRDSEGQRGARELDPKWGRFLPHRFNWDEIPWAFIGGLSHTWDMKVRVYFVFFGSVVVGCKHGACEPARQRFLHEAICSYLLRGDGLLCRLAVIFRGLGKVNQAEKSSYHPDITVLWQPKAWMNTTTQV